LTVRGESVLTVHTFGDSILDCGNYNGYAVEPGQLLVRNHDRLFPEFIGRDLSARGPTKLAHHAIDGSVVDDLDDQLAGLVVEEPSLALLTIGGNDLLIGLLDDAGPGIDTFVRKLDAFLRALPLRRVLIGTVYDPTFGDDALNVFGVDPGRGRENHRRINNHLLDLGHKYGAAVDLHRHFLGGRPDWYACTIEPSLNGTSEIRRCFLEAIDAGAFV
jgi:acyl-CoA thioesterase-1